MLARLRSLMDPAATPLSSSKVREKLQKLAEWRIAPSSIKFEQGASEFHGGYATVSQAFLRAGRKYKSHGRTITRKPIAVKKLKIENGKDKEQVLGLALREAGFLTGLSHENVIKLEGFVEDLSENRVWLVFPWAANGNLKDFVASADWEIPERVWLIDDVTRGVEYLHKQTPPIYHGDLKSANVLVNSRCRAVITDFGSARRLTKKDPPVRPEKSKKDAQPTLSLETEFCEATNTMTLKGNQFTLRWAAPELLMEEEPGMESGLWSDIWALGWIFYEVLTNSIPFQNVQKDSAVLIHVIQGKVPSVADHASMVLIRKLYSLMITCWSIDPSKRPTAEDCQKLMNWMPMTIPDRQRAANTSVSRTRSPQLLIKMGEMHLSQSDYTNASKFYTEALGICTETADHAGKADALFRLADVNRIQRNYTEAAQLYSEVVQICTDIGDRQRRAMAMRGLASVHGHRHQYSDAIMVYSEVIQIYTEIDHASGKADAFYGLAGVHRRQGEYSKALPLYTKAAQIYTDIGNRLGRGQALWGLAEVSRMQKQSTQAVQLFSEALQICIDIGDKDGRARALLGLANVHRDQDQHEDAIPLYVQAAGIFEEIGNTRDAEKASNSAALSRQKLKPAEAE